MFRPERMIWIDVLIDRENVQTAIRHLAGARIIELRPYDRGEPPFEVARDPDLFEQLTRIRERLDQYQLYLPGPDPAGFTGETDPRPTIEILPEVKERADTWLLKASPMIMQIEEIATELERLEILRQCLAAIAEDGEQVDLRYFCAPPSGRQGRYVPIVGIGRPGDEVFFSHTGDRSLFQTFPVREDPEQRVFVGCADADIVSELERSGHARGARFASVPPQISGPPNVALRQLDSLIEQRRNDAASLRNGINNLNQELEFAGWLWLLHRHIWMQEVLHESLVGVRFVWLGGWIVARRFEELVALLEASGVPFLINRDEYSDHGEPPVHLSNPAWVRMFEIFARAFGMPAHKEIDPSPVLAVTTPLMFGYMFGDIGHGFIILSAGLLLRRRYPITELLLPAGIASMIFGAVFGSIFGNEHLMPALWLHPMEDPMRLLLTPLAFGFVFIITGIGLSCIQSYWAGRARHWWWREFPVAAMYGSVALGIWYVDAALAVGLGALAMYLFALARSAGRRGGAAGGILSGVFELIEVLAQLLINTVSFARLGAFALAHAGLNTAVLTLTEMPSSMVARATIFILGNILVILLEGLVVSIQTTRLIMFEFFRRFYTGGGSMFRPLTLPESKTSGSA